MWIILGLGNPGVRYAHTRHNVGYDTIAKLCEDTGVSLKASRQTRSLMAQTRIGTLPGGAPGPAAVLAIADTHTFMNESGGPAKSLLQYFHAQPEDLLVIHDDLDLNPHQLRLKLGGGEGGHNGLRSISGALNTKNYHRVRIGIGHPTPRVSVVDHVLSGFPAAERTDWDITIANAADAVKDIVQNGFEAAQQTWHSRN